MPVGGNHLPSGHWHYDGPLMRSRFLSAYRNASDIVCYSSYNLPQISAASVVFSGGGPMRDLDDARMKMRCIIETCAAEMDKLRTYLTAGALELAGISLSLAMLSRHVSGRETCEDGVPISLNMSVNCANERIVELIHRDGFRSAYLPHRPSHLDELVDDVRHRMDTLKRDGHSVCLMFEPPWEEEMILASKLASGIGFTAMAVPWPRSSLDNEELRVKLIRSANSYRWADFEDQLVMRGY